MAFELKTVVPWGRTLDEYKRMFALSETDMDKKIISFGDGPASFNSEMKQYGHKVISIDPVYRFSEEEIRSRIDETKVEVLEQTRQNVNNFVWGYIKDIAHLEDIRMEAMTRFLGDFEKGKKEGRYICHSLPQPVPFGENEFDLGLSSHFLILYPQLGVDFHIQSIHEMLRICNEIRIFPLLDLDAKPSEVLNRVIDKFSKNYEITIIPVDYEFQRHGNEMLKIKKSN